MRTRILLGLVVIALLGLGARWYLQRGASSDVVFLIVVDTLRADRLSCYGDEDQRTPNIDALAARGVMFDNAISVGGWTVPSMGALMTSRYPTQLGLIEVPRPTRPFFKTRERRQQWEFSIALEFTTMAEALRDAGYHTMAFVNQPVLVNKYREGFSQGFSEWTYPISADSVISRDLRPGSGVPQPTHDATTWKEVFKSDSVLVDAFVEWLPRAPREKLFVWVHLLTPHVPYLPPARFIDPGKNLPSDRYDAEVRFADELVGKVLDTIDQEFGLDRSLVVFTSDHGEEFGEHGSKDHGHTLHRECVHVPLIFSGPQLPRGKRVTSAVRLLDMTPTILSMCGAGAVEGAEGTDLTPMIEGQELDLPVFSEGMLYGSTERALIDGDHRLMWDEQGDVYRLFDLREDRAETVDVGAQNEATMKRMRQEMIDLHQRLAADRARLIREMVVDDSLSTAAERERALNAMRALGYVNE